MYLLTFTLLATIFPITSTMSHGQRQIAGHQVVVNVSITRSNSPLSYLPVPPSPISFDPMPMDTYGGDLTAPAANLGCSPGQEKAENNAFVMACENGQFRPRACLTDGQRIESGATLNTNGYVYSCIKLPMGIELKPTACLDDSGVPQYPGSTFVEQKNFLFECQATPTQSVKKQVVGCVGDDQQRAAFGSTVFVRGVTANCIKFGTSARIVGQTNWRAAVGNIVSPCQQLLQPSSPIGDNSYAQPVNPSGSISKCPYQQLVNPGSPSYQAPADAVSSINAQSGNFNDRSPGNFRGPSGYPSSSVDSNSYAQPVIPNSPINSYSNGQPVNPSSSIDIDFRGPLANPSNLIDSNPYVQPAIPNSPISSYSNGQPANPADSASGSSYAQPVNPGISNTADFHGTFSNPGSPANGNPYGQPSNPMSSIPGNSYEQPANPNNLNNDQYQQPLNPGELPYPLPISPDSSYRQQPSNSGGPISNINQQPLYPDGSINANSYQPQLLNPGGSIPGSSYQQPVNSASPTNIGSYQQQLSPLQNDQKPIVEVVREVQM